MLNNGVMMPTVGFGTAGLGDGTLMAVSNALKAGYRHFDSAQVGRGAWEGVGAGAWSWGEDDQSWGGDAALFTLNPGPCPPPSSPSVEGMVPGGYGGGGTAGLRDSEVTAVRHLQGAPQRPWLQQHDEGVGGDGLELELWGRSMGGKEGRPGRAEGGVPLDGPAPCYMLLTGIRVDELWLTHV